MKVYFLLVAILGSYFSQANRHYNGNWLIKKNDTMTVNFTMPSYWNIIKIHDAKFYVLNTDSNLLFIKDLTSNVSRYIKLNKSINEQVNLAILRINETDRKLTEDNILHSSNQISKLITIKNINFIDDDLIFTCSLKYFHYANNKEVLEMKENMKTNNIKFDFSPSDTNMILSGSKVLILKYVMGLGQIESYVVDEEREGYVTDAISGCFFDNRTGFYNIPTNFYGASKVRKEFEKKNILYMSYSIDTLNHALHKISSCEIKRPIWFGEKERSLMYSNGDFQDLESNKIFYLHSYPYFVDLETHRIYEVPLGELNNISRAKENKKEKFSIMNNYFLGVFRHHQSLILLSSTKQNNMIANYFDDKGKFVGQKEIKNTEKGYKICDGKSVYILKTKNSKSADDLLIKLDFDLVE